MLFQNLEIEMKLTKEKSEINLDLHGVNCALNF